ncbi:jg2268 [Pararge aegeria aegeria]|uniref:Jg2268 protein n=1 Tax=Pararge aegeria aegeria TaxID=348720 RepID=A0A8S4RTZ6_9NEOP|nr:jg2268 [Pararge aegeria aegeria]
MFVESINSHWTGVIDYSLNPFPLWGGAMPSDCTPPIASHSYWYIGPGVKGRSVTVIAPSMVRVANMVQFMAYADAVAPRIWG